MPLNNLLNNLFLDDDSKLAQIILSGLGALLIYNLNFD